MAEEILATIVQEEARRQSLPEIAVERILAYFADAYGDGTPEMIAAFMEDRERTVDRISQGLERGESLHPEVVRAMATPEDADLRFAAALYLPLEEGLPLMREVIAKDRTQAARHRVLAAHLLRSPESRKQHSAALLQALRAARDLDEDNAIYGFVMAGILIETAGAAGGWHQIFDALSRPEVETGRVEESRLRRRLLGAVEFNPVYRATEAWQGSRSPFTEAVSRTAAALRTLSEISERKGEPRAARDALETARLMALHIRARAVDLTLWRAAHRILLRTLDAEADLADRQGHPCVAREFRLELEAVREREKREASAEEKYRLREADLLLLGPIVDPAATREFLRNVLSGERRYFRRFAARVAPPGKPVGEGVR